MVAVNTEGLISERACISNTICLKNELDLLVTVARKATTVKMGSIFSAPALSALRTESLVYVVKFGTQRS